MFVGIVLTLWSLEPNRSDDSESKRLSNDWIIDVNVEVADLPSNDTTADLVCVALTYF